MKITCTISIEKETQRKIKELAIKQNRSFSNMVEKILIEYIKGQK